jgi:hypothetical protein
LNLKTGVVVAGLLAAFGLARAYAQAKPLEGVIDIHVHTAPDSVPRSIDAIDLAKLAQSRGMRAIVLKNHFAPTAADAYLVHKVVPELQVFGGIDLNLSVGGMNPTAVEKMALTTGHLGKLVWMATYDTRAQVMASGEHRPFVAVSQDGVLLPEAKAVIAMIVRYDLVMATGHNSPEDDLLLLREGKAEGGEDGRLYRVCLQRIDRQVEAVRLCGLCKGDSRGWSGTLHPFLRHGAGG